MSQIASFRSPDIAHSKEHDLVRSRAVTQHRDHALTGRGSRTCGDEFVALFKSLDKGMAALARSAQDALS